MSVKDRISCKVIVTEVKELTQNGCRRREGIDAILLPASRNSEAACVDSLIEELNNGELFHLAHSPIVFSFS
jgi:hypothetical protein